MKKILINITNGFSLRYLCHTQILETLRKKPNIKIYILSKDAAATKKNLEFEDLTYLEYDSIKLNQFKNSSRIYNFLETLRLYIHGGNFKTPSIMFDYLIIEKSKKKLLSFLIFFFRKFKFLRKLLLFAQSKYFHPEIYKILKNVNPDLVITSSLGVFSFDEYVLRVSKLLGIKTCSCILSWDNSTTRGYPGSLPDKIFVWTEIMKNEIIKFSDCENKDIIVGGIPHFDNYFINSQTNRENILKKFRIENDKKIILFVTKGPSTFQFNPNIVDFICKNIEDNNLKNVHLIARIHPLFYKINNNGELEFKDALNVFKDLEKKYSSFSIDYPSITSLNQNFEMNKNEQIYLKNLITSSDIILNIFSTLNIEGSILNKSLVNIDFDDFEPMYKWNKKFERQSLSVDRNLDHNSRIMSYGGIFNTKNKSELLNVLKFSLNNFNKNQQGMKKIVEMEAGPNQGCSGKFIAEKIFSFL